MEAAMDRPPKPLMWMGSSKKDLRALPQDVVATCGYSLYLAQTGRRHEGAKVLKGFGDAGVIEVVDADESGTYRAVYTVRFTVAVFVLHVFQKKSKFRWSTPKPDMELIRHRLKIAAQTAKDLQDEYS